MVTPSKVAFILIFVEMAIFITYYKDVIFAITTLTNFIGMYYTSQRKLPEADRHWFFNHNKYRALFSLTEEQFAASDPTDGLPVKTDFNSPKVIRNWLTGFMLLNIIFVVTTLVTDWRTCFYRKASQYKRRVDSAVE